MSKVSKNFEFIYPLRHKIVRDLKIVTEPVGDLTVEGISYCDAGGLNIFDRFAVDIDTVKWNGTDVKPLLSFTGMMDEITEAAVRYVASLEPQQSREAASLQELDALLAQAYSQLKELNGQNQFNLSPPVSVRVNDRHLFECYGLCAGPKGGRLYVMDGAGEWFQVEARESDAAILRAVAKRVNLMYMAYRTIQKKAS